MLDLATLIPIGASILGGVFGGEKKTTTSTQLSPEMEAAAAAIFERAMGSLNKDYPKYPGPRVAPQTASRQALGSYLPNLGATVGKSAQAADKYGAQIDKLLGMKPMNISVPTLTGNSVASTMSGGAGGMGGGGDASAFLEAARSKYDPNRVAYKPGSF